MTDITQPHDNVMTNTTKQVVHSDSLPNVSTYQAMNNPGRTNQQQVLPGAINTRQFGNIISSSSVDPVTGTYSKTALVPAGDSAVVTFTISDSVGRVISATPDISLYDGILPSAETQWPTTTMTAADFPWYWSNDYQSTDFVNVVTRIVIQNNSASDRTVTISLRYRVITNAQKALDVGTIASNG